MATAMEKNDFSARTLSSHSIVADDTYTADVEADVLGASRTIHETKSTSTLAGGGSVLQSTPRVGTLPNQPTNMPSAIKPHSSHGSSYKKIFSVLTSIAEMTLKSPLKPKKNRESLSKSAIVLSRYDTDAATNNNEPSRRDHGDLLETISRCENDSLDKGTDLDALCTCDECKDAVSKDVHAAAPSETSHSIVSLLSTDDDSVSLPPNDYLLDDPGEETIEIPETPTTRNKRKDRARFSTLNKFFSSKFAAGRRSLSQHIHPSRTDGDDKSETGTINSFTSRWRSTRSSLRSHKDLIVPELLGSFHAETSSRRSSLLSDRFMRDRNQSANASLESMMMSSARTESIRDPLLKELMQELQNEILNQERVLVQASKALDQCGGMMRKATEGILFAEQVLHLASQRYFAAEEELHRLLDGDDFEPQRDRVVLRQISFDLCPTFIEQVANSAKKYIFVVLFRWGHNVESSDIITLKPRQKTVIARKANSDLNGVPQEGDLEMTFNRPHWCFTVEIYSVFIKQPRGSVLNLNGRAHKKGDEKRDFMVGGDELRGLRKSSFGKLASGSFSKSDILNGNSVSLTFEQSPSPLEAKIRIDGDAFLNKAVFHEGYLGVKDFYGTLGWIGRMKTFNAKLFHSRLDLFEICESSNETAKPAHTIELSVLTADRVYRDSFNTSYFHDFTLKLGNTREEWLNLCTNSREDTAIWIDKIRTAIVPTKKYSL